MENKQNNNNNNKLFISQVINDVDEDKMKFKVFTPKTIYHFNNKFNIQRNNNGIKRNNKSDNNIIYNETNKKPLDTHKAYSTSYKFFQIRKQKCKEKMDEILKEKNEKLYGELRDRPNISPSSREIAKNLRDLYKDLESNNTSNINYNNYYQLKNLDNDIKNKKLKGNNLILNEKSNEFFENNYNNDNDNKINLIKNPKFNNNKNNVYNLEKNFSSSNKLPPYYSQLENKLAKQNLYKNINDNDINLIPEKNLLKINNKNFVQNNQQTNENNNNNFDNNNNINNMNNNNDNRNNYNYNDNINNNNDNNNNNFNNNLNNNNFNNNKNFNNDNLNNINNDNFNNNNNNNIDNFNNNQNNNNLNNINNPFDENFLNRVQTNQNITNQLQEKIFRDSLEINDIIRNNPNYKYREENNRNLQYLKNKIYCPNENYNLNYDEFNNKCKYDELTKNELRLREIDNRFRENNNNLEYLNRKLENNFNLKNNLSNQFDLRKFNQNLFSQRNNYNNCLKYFDYNNCCNNIDYYCFSSFRPCYNLTYTLNTNDLCFDFERKY